MSRILFRFCVLGVLFFFLRGLNNLCGMEKLKEPPKDRPSGEGSIRRLPPIPQKALPPIPGQEQKEVTKQEEPGKPKVPKELSAAASMQNKMQQDRHQRSNTQGYRNIQQSIFLHNISFFF